METTRPRMTSSPKIKEHFFRIAFPNKVFHSKAPTKAKKYSTLIFLGRGARGRHDSHKGSLSIGLMIEQPLKNV